MMARISISQDDVVDVEFETVSRGGDAPIAASLTETPRQSSSQIADQLSLLRNEFLDPKKSTHPDQLSPTFLGITLICACVVFWVSGGHALLY
jgi:hypothetical protein